MRVTCGTSCTLPTERTKRKEASGDGGGYPYRDTSVADTDISPVSVLHRPANSASFPIHAHVRAFLFLTHTHIYPSRVCISVPPLLFVPL